MGDGERQAVIEMLASMENVNSGSYRVGLSKVSQILNFHYTILLRYSTHFSKHLILCIKHKNYSIMHDLNNIFVKHLLIFSPILWGIGYNIKRD
jgi:hypothetical protein